MVGAGVFNVPDDVVTGIIKKCLNYFREYDCDILVHGYSKTEASNLMKSLDQWVNYIGEDKVMDNPLKINANNFLINVGTSDNPLFLRGLVLPSGYVK